MSNTDGSSSSQIRFDTFDVDVRSGELRKDGIGIPLQQQPFRVLAQLLDHPGEIVTREALRRELWPSDTFVDFEHGLNVAIARVREALGDEAEHPRFIETLPKRGYRFIAPVERAPTREARRKVRPMVWAAFAIALGGVTAVGVVQMRRQPVLTDRDTILVTDFVNKTGEDVFDDTLRQALTVDLEQSPFLSVVSRERVRDTLQQMTRSPDERVTGSVARELCQRVGATASVNGSIARLGTQYLIDLEAIACETGSALGRTEQTASGPERIVNALGVAASQLRSRLGESRAMLQRFDRPLAEATTASLDALKAYTIGNEKFDRVGNLEAEPFYLRATALDPQFALAYARLAVVYGNTSRFDEMRQAEERANALPQRVTERERLVLLNRHCVNGLESQFDCIQNVQEIWKRTYPRDPGPYVMLCYIFNARGAFEKAVDYGVEAVRLGPDSYLSYGNLIASYMALNRFDEARRCLDSAFQHHPDVIGLHEQAFELAFVARDRRAMAVAAQAMHRDPQSLIETNNVEPRAAAFEGRLREARTMWQRSEQAGGQEWREGTRAEQTLVEAATGGHPDLSHVEFKSPFSGRNFLIAALVSRDRGRASQWLRELRFGELPPAQRPPLFDLARVLLNVLDGDRAAVDQLPERRPVEFRLAAGYRLVYLRGLAYAEAGRAAEAVEEFQRILDHRGIDPTSPLYPLAYVQQARAYALLGNVAQARNDYDIFFGFWKNADPDVPILQQAKAEYAALATATR